MAKDAKGHGSDGKGGSSYARQAPTKNGRARMYGTSMADRIKIAQDQQNIKEGRAAGSSGDPLGTGLSPRDVLAMRDSETANRVAAAALSSGGPKSAPIPIHDSMPPRHSAMDSEWQAPRTGHGPRGKIASDPTFERSPLTGENTGRRN
jgi:hypothetical protein